MVRARIKQWVRDRTQIQRVGVIVAFLLFWFSGRFWMPDQSGMEDSEVAIFVPIVVIFLVFFYVAVLSAIVLVREWRNKDSEPA